MPVMDVTKHPRLIRREECRLGRGSLASFNTPQKVPSAATWKMASLGNEHACGIGATGALACWGASNFAQLGSGLPFASSPTRILDP